MTFIYNKGMSMEMESVYQQPRETQGIKKEVNRLERHRLIAHLGRMFSRRYDIQVLPSRQKGLWACALDPKANTGFERYMKGEIATLDDLPPETFVPKKILYDEKAAQEMSMEEITTLLRHEAGHAKYTDFRLMIEGQKQAKDEGHLPTSFWLTFEGIEDPRVNTLEGEESPIIDKQIRTNQGNALKERITEAPLSQKPLMLQFAYNSFHYWLHGQPIPELVGTEVGRVTELARPLLEQYFQNSDLDQRRILQRQIWDIAKVLEKKDVEQEEMRQMAQQKKGQQGKGKQSGSGEGSQQSNPSGGSQANEQQMSGSSGEGTSQDGSSGSSGQEQQSSGSQQGEIESKGNSENQNSTGSGHGNGEEEAGIPHIPGGSGEGSQQRETSGSQRNGQQSSGTSGDKSGQTQGEDRQEENRLGNSGDKQKERKSLFQRIKDRITGRKDTSSEDESAGEKEASDNNSQDSSTSSGSQQTEESQGRRNQAGESQGKEGQKEKNVKEDKLDLSQFTPEVLQEIKDAIDQLSPSEREQLMKKAREAVDEDQKDALKNKLSKMLKLEKNKQTGEYEAVPQKVDEKTQKQAQEDFQKAVDQVDAEEQKEWEREEAERKQMEDIRKKLEAEQREKLDMEKAGFDEDEKDKFHLYQSLENSMYSYIRNFRQAMERVIPRKKETVYEGGYFSGSKFDKRELIKRAPLKDERFHMRQVEAPIGDPRLFIGLLVDNSRSMKGKKMEQARKTMIFFAQVCKEMKIPFMAAAFGDDAEVIKTFRQDFDNPSERIKPKIIDATDAKGGSTNMYSGIEITIKDMNEQRRRISDSHGIIFVITDGQANAGLTKEALRDYIEENRGRLTFKAFGLSESEQERALIQQYLNFYFGESNCAYPEGFEKLPDDAFRVLRINMIQFQRFLR